jgi:hypothetical protein
MEVAPYNDADVVASHTGSDTGKKCPYKLVIKPSGASGENASNCKVVHNTPDYSNVASFPPKYVKHLKKGQ